MCRWVHTTVVTSSRLQPALSNRCRNPVFNPMFLVMRRGLSLPTHVSNFDYWRFALGFPGIEIDLAKVVHAPEDTLEWSPPWTLSLLDHMIDTRGATIAITGEAEPELLADLDQRRAQRTRARLAAEKLLDPTAPLPDTTRRTAVLTTARSREELDALIRSLYAVSVAGAVTPAPLMVSVTPASHACERLHELQLRSLFPTRRRVTS